MVLYPITLDPYYVYDIENDKLKESTLLGKGVVKKIIKIGNNRIRPFTR
jgi:hypothetical protein